MSHVLCCQNLRDNLKNFVPFIMQLTQHKLRSIDVPSLQYQNLTQPPVELRLSHTVGNKNVPEIIRSTNC